MGWHTHEEGFMNKNDIEEVKRMLDGIIGKLATAIGSEFSPKGSSDLIEEVRVLQKEITDILDKNRKD